MGSGGALDSACGFLVRIYDDDLGRTSRIMSRVRILYSAVQLVVKTATKNEMSMQVGRWQ
jgi:hypothetical protein